MRASLLLIGSKSFQLGAAFILSLLVTKYLSMESRGHYFHLISTVSILVPVLNLGFAHSLQYHAANEKLGFSANVITSIHLLVLALITFVIVNFYFDGVVALYAVVMLIYLNLIKRYLGLGNFATYSIVEMAKPAGMILIVFIYNYGLSIETLLFYTILIITVQIFVIFPKITFSGSTEDVLAKSKSLYSFGLKAWLADSLNRGTAKLDIAILGTFISPQVLATYANAYVVSEAVWLIADGIAPKLFVQFAKSNATKREIYKLIMLIMFISLLSSILIYIIIQNYVDIIFGEKYARIKEILPYTLLAVLVLIPSKILSKYYAARGHINFVTIQNFGGLIVTGITLLYVSQYYSFKSLVLINLLTYSMISFVSLVIFLKRF